MSKRKIANPVYYRDAETFDLLESTALKYVARRTNSKEQIPEA